ncbi:MAG TPA: bifunctional riboflavin kinase/FAD synthetase [Anaerolineales bacterium]|nr:bifunctional riboflavin kinase/FAD synthetase [Anaerolineales bacterium]
MIHVRTLDEISLPRSWLTIGVFDGVHRGHQEIIRRLVTGAHAAGAAAVVLTFWPHPATVLGESRVKCLSTDDERADLLSALGVDALVTYPFDVSTAATSAKDFVEQLHRRLHFDHLLIGYDFALGKGREGDAARLSELGKTLGYDVEIVPALSDESGVISSTSIRKLVANGDVSAAAALLGHPYSLHGAVVAGDARGRELGFPTANIDYAPEKILPSNGIYACWLWLNGQRHSAAVNVGVRPQFHSGATHPLVEAYILDFDRNIYGQDVRLDFVRRIRDEMRFPFVSDLIAQIHHDVQQIQQVLGADNRR